MNAFRSLSLILLFLIIGLTAQPAHAQGSSAAAEALFEQAKQLMDEKKYAEACPKFAESHRLDPEAVGTLLNLATCYQEAGQTASAWASFKTALSLARRDSSAKGMERATYAEEHIKTLKPLLSRLTLDVPEGSRIAGLAVTRDGTEVQSPSWGVPIPVDPGEHVIAASAEGYKPWEQTVVVGAKGDLQTLTIPPLERAATPPPPPTKAKPGPTGVTPTPGGDEPDGSTQRTAGFVIVGIGGAAAVLGAVFGGMAISEEGDADELCGDGVAECSDPAAIDASDAAHTNATMANVFIFGGLGVAAVGLIVALVAPDGDGAEETAQLQPWVGPDGGGLGVALSW